MKLVHLILPPGAVEISIFPGVDNPLPTSFPRSPGSVFALSRIAPSSVLDRVVPLFLGNLLQVLEPATALG